MSNQWSQINYFLSSVLHRAMAHSKQRSSQLLVAATTSISVPSSASRRLSAAPAPVSRVRLQCTVDLQASTSLLRRLLYSETARTAKAHCVLLHSTTYYVYTTELLKGGCSWVGTAARQRRRLPTMAGGAALSAEGSFTYTLQCTVLALCNSRYAIWKPILTSLTNICQQRRAQHCST